MATHNIRFFPATAIPAPEPIQYGTGSGVRLDASPYILCQDCGHYHHPANMDYDAFWESYHCPNCKVEIYCKYDVWAWFVVERANKNFNE